MSLKIAILTWNQEAVYWNDQEAMSFLPGLFYNTLKQKPTLIVVGLQESPAAFMQKLKEGLGTFSGVFGFQGPKQPQLMTQIKTYLQRRGYTEVTKDNMMSFGATGRRGLRLRVYRADGARDVKALTHYKHVCENVNTHDHGLQNSFQAGSKGAIGIQVRVKGKDMMFVTAHLPFFAKDLPDQGLDARLGCLKLAMHELEVQGKSPPIAFLFGDLNFRVQVADPVPDINRLLREMVVSRTIRKVMEKDQLYHIRTELKQAHDPTFQSFSEGLDMPEQGFIPTCKWAKLDKFPKLGLTMEQCEELPGQPRAVDSKCLKTKNRTPSWCDRILFRGAVCEQYYGVRFGLMEKSDHAAVWGVFSVRLLD